jgi:secondary thiamine-phosphate synthase enzyme
MIIQKNIILKQKPRGYHLVTEELTEHIPEISQVRAGLLNILIQHTSASLTINENADPTVRKDFISYFDKLAPDAMPIFQHTEEGPDDMSAHIKSSILGASLNVPVTNGRLNLGTWQGIYLCEHRDGTRQRKIVLTLIGE